MFAGVLLELEHVLRQTSGSDLLWRSAVFGGDKVDGVFPDIVCSLMGGAVCEGAELLWRQGLCGSYGW